MPQTALRDARTHLTLALDGLPALEPGIEHPAARSLRAALAALDTAARELSGDDFALSRVADGSVGYLVDDLPVLEAVTHPAVMPDGASWEDAALLARVAAAGRGAGLSVLMVKQAGGKCRDDRSGDGGSGSCGADGGCGGCGCGGGGCDRGCGGCVAPQRSTPDSERLLRALTSAPVGGYLAA